jgi:hypothetical protein
MSGKSFCFTNRRNTCAWNQKRPDKSNPQSQTLTVAVVFIHNRKFVMSAAAKAKISAAVKARWAAKKAGEKK